MYPTNQNEQNESDGAEAEAQAEIHLNYAKKKQNWVLDNFDVTFPCIECGELVSSTEGHRKKISPLSYEALRVYVKVNCSLCGSFVSLATVIAGGVQKWSFHKTTGKFVCPGCSHELI